VSGSSTVLLVGASGNLGRATIPVLLEAGWRVRGMTRRPELLGELAGGGFEVVRGDLRDPDSLVSACAGVEAVVAAAHAALGNHGANRPATVDREGNRQLVRAAKNAGVGRVVFLSGNGASRDHPIDFFRIKAEAEGFVRESGLPFVILRPSPFMETWAEFAAGPILDKGRAILFGDVDKRVNYVAVRDVARFIEIALRDDDLLGTTLRLGGPENLTLEEVVATFESVADRPVRRTRIPGGVVRVVELLARPFLPALHRVLALAMLPAGDEDLFDPQPLLARYPIELTPLEVVARERALKTGTPPAR